MKMFARQHEDEKLAQLATRIPHRAGRAAARVGGGGEVVADRRRALRVALTSAKCGGCKTAFPDPTPLEGEVDELVELTDGYAEDVRGARSPQEIDQAVRYHLLLLRVPLL